MATPTAVCSLLIRWKSSGGLQLLACSGSKLTTESRTLTVIGVAARGFRGVEVENHAEMWTPVTVRPADNSRYFWLLARRRPGVSAAQVQSVENHFATEARHLFLRTGKQQAQFFLGDEGAAMDLSSRHTHQGICNRAQYPDERA